MIGQRCVHYTEPDNGTRVLQAANQCLHGNMIYCDSSLEPSQQGNAVLVLGHNVCFYEKKVVILKVFSLYLVQPQPYLKMVVSEIKKFQFMVKLE